MFGDTISSKRNDYIKVKVIQCTYTLATFSKYKEGREKISVIESYTAVKQDQSDPIKTNK